MRTECGKWLAYACVPPRADLCGWFDGRPEDEGESVAVALSKDIRVAVAAPAANVCLSHTCEGNVALQSTKQQCICVKDWKIKVISVAAGGELATINSS